jgi:hypothetical protein
MKRAAGAVLLGAGVFFLITAALMWFYVGPSLLKAPLNQDTTTVAEAQNATYLKISPDGNVSIEKNAKLTATRVVRGDVEHSSTDRVVYDVGLSVTNAEGTVIKAYTDRVASDRVTAEAVACCNENVDGNAAKHEGLSYKFPFSTQRKDYSFFDVLAKKAYPMRFKEATSLRGIDVYRFEQEISDVFLESRKVPGKLVNQTGNSIDADLLYSNVRTVWIEPVTGSIVKGQEVQRQDLDVKGSKTNVLDATLVFTDKTVAERVDDAKKAMAKVQVIRAAPIVLGALGLVFVLLSIALLRVPRRAGSRRAGSRTPEAAGV